MADNYNGLYLYEYEDFIKFLKRMTKSGSTSDLEKHKAQNVLDTMSGEIDLIRMENIADMTNSGNLAFKKALEQSNKSFNIDKIVHEITHSGVLHDSQLKMVFHYDKETSHVQVGFVPESEYLYAAKNGWNTKKNPPLVDIMIGDNYSWGEHNQMTAVDKTTARMGANNEKLYLNSFRNLMFELYNRTVGEKARQPFDGQESVEGFFKGLNKRLSEEVPNTGSGYTVKAPLLYGKGELTPDQIKSNFYKAGQVNEYTGIIDLIKKMPKTLKKMVAKNDGNEDYALGKMSEYVFDVMSRIGMGLIPNGNDAKSMTKFNKEVDRFLSDMNISSLFVEDEKNILKNYLKQTTPNFHFGLGSEDNFMEQQHTMVRNLQAWSGLFGVDESKLDTQTVNTLPLKRSKNSKITPYYNAVERQQSLISSVQENKIIKDIKETQGVNINYNGEDQFLFAELDTDTFLEAISLYNKKLRENEKILKSWEKNDNFKYQKGIMPAIKKMREIKERIRSQQSIYDNAVEKTKKFKEEYETLSQQIEASKINNTSGVDIATLEAERDDLKLKIEKEIKYQKAFKESLDKTIAKEEPERIKTQKTIDEAISRGEFFTNDFQELYDIVRDLRQGSMTLSALGLHDGGVIVNQSMLDDLESYSDSHSHRFYKKEAEEIMTMSKYAFRIGRIKQGLVSGDLSTDKQTERLRKNILKYVHERIERQVLTDEESKKLNDPNYVAQEDPQKRIDDKYQNYIRKFDDYFVNKLDFSGVSNIDNLHEAALNQATQAYLGLNTQSMKDLLIEGVKLFIDPNAFKEDNLLKSDIQGDEDYFLPEIRKTFPGDVASRYIIGDTKASVGSVPARAWGIFVNGLKKVAEGQLPHELYKNIDYSQVQGIKGLSRGKIQSRKLSTVVGGYLRKDIADMKKAMATQEGQTQVKSFFDEINKLFPQGDNGETAFRVILPDANHRYGDIQTDLDLQKDPDGKVSFDFVKTWIRLLEDKDHSLFNGHSQFRVENSNGEDYIYRRSDGMAFSVSPFNPSSVGVYGAPQAKQGKNMKVDPKVLGSLKRELRNMPNNYKTHDNLFDAIAKYFGMNLETRPGVAKAIQDDVLNSYLINPEDDSNSVIVNGSELRQAYNQYRELTNEQKYSKQTHDLKDEAFRKSPLGIVEEKIKDFLQTHPDADPRKLNVYMKLGEHNWVKGAQEHGSDKTPYYTRYIPLNMFRQLGLSEIKKNADNQQLYRINYDQIGMKALNGLVSQMFTREGIFNSLYANKAFQTFQEDGDMAMFFDNKGDFLKQAKTVAVPNSSNLSLISSTSKAGRSIVKDRENVNEFLSGGGILLNPKTLSAQLQSYDSALDVRLHNTENLVELLDQMSLSSADDRLEWTKLKTKLTTLDKNVTADQEIYATQQKKIADLIVKAVSFSPEDSSKWRDNAKKLTGMLGRYPFITGKDIYGTSIGAMEGIGPTQVLGSVGLYAALHGDVDGDKLFLSLLNPFLGNRADYEPFVNRTGEYSKLNEYFIQKKEEEDKNKVEPSMDKDTFSNIHNSTVNAVTELLSRKNRRYIPTASFANQVTREFFTDTGLDNQKKTAFGTKLMSELFTILEQDPISAKKIRNKDLDVKQKKKINRQLNLLQNLMGTYFNNDGKENLFGKRDSVKTFVDILSKDIEILGGDDDVFNTGESKSRIIADFLSIGRELYDVNNKDEKVAKANLREAVDDLASMLDVNVSKTKEGGLNRQRLEKIFSPFDEKGALLKNFNIYEVDDEGKIINGTDGKPIVHSTEDLDFKFGKKALIDLILKSNQWIIDQAEKDPLHSYIFEHGYNSLTSYGKPYYLNKTTKNAKQMTKLIRKAKDPRLVEEIFRQQEREMQQYLNELNGVSNGGSGFGGGAGGGAGGGGYGLIAKSGEQMYQRYLNEERYYREKMNYDQIGQNPDTNDNNSPVFRIAKSVSGYLDKLFPTQEIYGDTTYAESQKLRGITNQAELDAYIKEFEANGLGEKDIVEKLDTAWFGPAAGIARHAIAHVIREAEHRGIDFEGQFGGNVEALIKYIKSGQDKKFTQWYNESSAKTDLENYDTVLKYYYGKKYKNKSQEEVAKMISKERGLTYDAGEEFGKQITKFYEQAAHSEGNVLYTKKGKPRAKGPVDFNEIFFRAGFGKAEVKSGIDFFRAYNTKEVGTGENGSDKNILQMDLWDYKPGDFLNPRYITQLAFYAKAAQDLYNIAKGSENKDAFLGHSKIRQIYRDNGGDPDKKNNLIDKELDEKLTHFFNLVKKSDSFKIDTRIMSSTPLGTQIVNTSANNKLLFGAISEAILKDPQYEILSKSHLKDNTEVRMIIDGFNNELATRALANLKYEGDNVPNATANYKKYVEESRAVANTSAKLEKIETQLQHNEELTEAEKLKYQQEREKLQDDLSTHLVSRNTAYDSLKGSSFGSSEAFKETEQQMDAYSQMKNEEAQTDKEKFLLQKLTKKYSELLELKTSYAQIKRAYDNAGTDQAVEKGTYKISLDATQERIEQLETETDLLSTSLQLRGQKTTSEAARREEEKFNRKAILADLKDKKDAKLGKYDQTLGGYFSHYKTHLNQGIKQFIMYQSSFYMLFGKLSKMYQQVKQQAQILNKSLVDLQIVTGGTAEETRGLLTEYSALGKEIGATTTEVAQAANNWLRQGYEAQEVTDLITASLYLSKLGMMNSADATKSLTSALKGFKLEASEALGVVDKLTAVDMSAAVSAGDIATGLSQFAVTAQQQGVSMDEAIAMVTTISDVSQKSTSSVGAALKTVLSRYGNVKPGAFVSNQEGEEGKKINDIEKVLNTIGIEIRTVNNEMRDFDDVLEEVSERWAGLDQISKNAISTAFAGVRQREAFLILMENMDRYHHFIDISKNSKGVASDKFKSYSEQLEASQKRLANAFESFTNNESIQSTFKNIADGLTVVAQWLPFVARWGQRFFSQFAANTASKGIFNSVAKLAEKYGISLDGSTPLEYLRQARETYRTNKAEMAALSEEEKLNLISHRKEIRQQNRAYKHQQRRYATLQEDFALKGKTPMSIWKNYNLSKDEMVYSAAEIEAQKAQTEENYQLEKEKREEEKKETLKKEAEIKENNKKALEEQEKEVKEAHKAFEEAKKATPTIPQLKQLQEDYENKNQKYKEAVENEQARIKTLEAEHKAEEAQEKEQEEARVRYKTLYDPAMETAKKIVDSMVKGGKKLPAVFVEQVKQSEEMKAAVDKVINEAEEKEFKDKDGNIVEKYNPKTPEGQAARKVYIDDQLTRSGAVEGIYNRAKEEYKMSKSASAQRYAAKGFMYASRAAAGGIEGYMNYDQSTILKDSSGREYSVEMTETEKSKSRMSSSMKGVGMAIPILGPVISALGDMAMKNDWFGWFTESRQLGAIQKKASERSQTLSQIIGGIQNLQNSIENKDVQEGRNNLESIAETLYARDKEGRDINKGGRAQFEHHLKNVLGDKVKGKSLLEIINQMDDNIEEQTELSHAMAIAQERANRENILAANTKANLATDVQIGDAMAQYRDSRYIDKIEAAGTSEGLKQAAAGGGIGVGVGAASGVITGLIAAGMGASATGVGAAIGIPVAAIGLIIGAIVGGIEGKKQGKEEEARKLREKERTIISSHSDQIRQIERSIEELKKDPTQENLATIDEYQNLIRDLKEARGQKESVNKKLNQSLVAEAILGTKDEKSGLYLTELSTGSLKHIGKYNVEESIGKYIEEQGGLEGYNVFKEDGSLSEYAQHLISSEIKKNNRLSSVYEGKVYTLQDAMQLVRSGDKNKARQGQEILENFASALGVSVDKLNDFEVQASVSALTLGDLITSTQDAAAAINNFSKDMKTLTDSGTTEFDRQQLIISKYPELIDNMNDLSVVLDHLKLKGDQLAEQTVNKVGKEILDSDEYFNNIRDNDVSSIVQGFITDHPNLSVNDINSLNSASNISKLIDVVLGMEDKSIGEELIERIKGHLKNINIVSDINNAEMKHAVEYRTALLDKELDNLNQQKQAISEITSKREYENKLIEARLKLENVQNQKRRVWRNGLGWVYQTDQDAILKAEEDLEKLDQEKIISELDLEIAQKQADKEAIDKFFSDFTWNNMEKLYNTYFGGAGGTTIGALLQDISKKSAGFQNTLDNILENEVVDKEGKRKELADNAYRSRENFKNISSQYHMETNSSSSNYGSMVDNNGKLLTSDQIKEYNMAYDEYKKYYDRMGSGNYTDSFGHSFTKDEIGSMGSDKNISDFSPLDTLMSISYGGQTYYSGEGGRVWNLNDQEKWTKKGGSNVLELIDPKTDRKLSIKYDGQKYHIYRGHYNNKDTDLNHELDSNFTLNKTDSLFDFLGSDRPKGFFGDIDQIMIRQAKVDGANSSLEGMPLNYNLKSGGLYRTRELSSEDFAKNAQGNVSFEGGKTLLNELGTEAIITPQGTITSLPSSSGILPADITKSLWSLGEIAPTLSRWLLDPEYNFNKQFSSRQFNNDESFNVGTINMEINADESFDAEAWVNSIKNKALLSRNNN